MGYQQMTRAEWADLIAKVGYEEAANIARNFGTKIAETNLPPTAVDPSMAARPMQVSPAAPASATVAPAIQGTPNMSQPMGGLNAAANPQGPQEMPVDDLNAQLTALYKQQAAMPEQEAQRYKTRFEDSQRRINEMYGGPSTSQSLFALSRALLAPRRYKGFGGTMYNVTQALEGIGQQREAADQKRAEALARLQESYDERMAGTRTDALNAQIKLLEMRGEQEAAAAKARQPATPVWDSTSQRFVSRDVPVPTDRKGVLNGQQVVQYTDGTLRVTKPDGTQMVYDANGRLLSNAQGGE